MLFLIRWIQKISEYFIDKVQFSMRRQLDLTRNHVHIGTLGKNERDAIEPSATLVVSLNRIPGRLQDIGIKNASSLTFEYSIHFSRDLRSISLSFERLSRFWARSWKCLSCSSLLTDSQYMRKQRAMNK